MLNNIHLNNDILKRVESKSIETGLKPEEIITNILEDNIDDYVDDYLKFVERTESALARIEAGAGKELSVDEFLEEMDTW